MKKVFFVMFVLAAFTFSAKSFAATTSAIVGTWKVEAPDAPYEYSKSALVISETDKVLTAKLVFEGNQEIKVSSFEFAKDMLKFTVTIDGNDIYVKGKLENAKITGSAETPDGEMKFTAVKGN